MTFSHIETRSCPAVLRYDLAADGSHGGPAVIFVKKAVPAGGRDDATDLVIVSGPLGHRGALARAVQLSERHAGPTLRIAVCEPGRDDDTRPDVASPVLLAAFDAVFVVRRSDSAQFVRRLVKQTPLPMVLDADALNALAGCAIPTPAPRVLTPHPGEMARLVRASIADVQGDRVGVARAFAQQQGVWIVLKGNRSLIASPGGEVWVNPTGSPAMATGGSGDVLTGMIAGLLAQFPDDLRAVLLAAVWIHGRAGELAAAKLGEKCVIAGDLLQLLPESIREHADVSHGV